MTFRSFLWRFLLAVGVVVVAALVSAPAYGAEGSFDRSLKVSGPVDLDVQTGSGSIVIRAGGSDTVHVVGNIHASGGWDGLSPEEKVSRLQADPPVEQSGNSIRIGHIEDRELRNVSISYEITVPAQTSVRSETGSGHQEITGLHGEVKAHSGSGSLEIRDAGTGVSAHTGSGSIDLENVSGDVVAVAGSGNLTGHLLGAGSVEAETGSGRIDLEGVKGRLHAETGSGRISVEGAPVDDWTLDTGSGGVRLHLPADAAFDFYAHTGSGNIEMNHELTVQGRISRSELRGKVHGGGRLVEVKTGSGSIEVE